MIFYFSIVESEDVETMLFQKFFALKVTLYLLWLCMDSTIEFNFELLFDAKVIKDVGTERMLSAKFQTRKSTASQCLPQFFLSGS